MQLSDTHRAYAQLLLETGINLQPGINIVVSGEPIHWPFLNLLAEEAYKAGARFVELDARHPGAAKARVDHSREEFPRLHSCLHRAAHFRNGIRRVGAPGALWIGSSRPACEYRSAAKTPSSKRPTVKWPSP